MAFIIQSKKGSFACLLPPHHAQYIAWLLSRRMAADAADMLAITLVDAPVDLNPLLVEAVLFAFHIIATQYEQDYIPLTDMVDRFGGANPSNSRGLEVMNSPGFELTPRSWTVEIPPVRRCFSAGNPPG
jgi:hypothetical protein